MADKEKPTRQPVSLPWYVVVPLWLAAIGVWIAVDFIQAVASMLMRS